MIKVKLLNHHKGRNEHTFDNLSLLYASFLECGIELILPDCNPDIYPDIHARGQTSDYDYLFVGMEDFMDKKLSLSESVEWGLENLEKVTEGGSYCLFDGSDSTSLLGSYEVFEKSNAIYLFKNQLLDREEYNRPLAFNKWFFGNNSDFNIGYNIPKDKWENIKLSGINLGYTYMSRIYAWKHIPYPFSSPDDRFMAIHPFNSQYHSERMYRRIPNNEKIHDIFSVCLTNINESYEHGYRNDKLYIKHRKTPWAILKKMKYDTYYSDHLGAGVENNIKYLKEMALSKIGLSPYGQGEICYRDAELMQFGTLMIKPDMSKINTIPNPYIDGKTYIACRYDWSDLEEKIDYILSDFDNINELIVTGMREEWINKYSAENLVSYWYNMINNITEEVSIDKKEQKLAWWEKS